MHTSTSAMLKNVTPRLYQETILNTAINKNCLVVLPTGMGKTLIAVMLAVQRLSQYPHSKIVFLSPTKPLVEQHLQTFKTHLDLDDSSYALFTGFVKPEKRAELWKQAKIIFSTPQGLENDVLSKRISLETVSLIIFDEAHRAVGDYAYVFLAKQYHRTASLPKILALTASPGSDMEKITEICQHLYIDDVEIRTDTDPDVQPYVQEVAITWVKVKLPPDLLEAKKYLEVCAQSKLREVKQLGYTNSTQLNKGELLKLQGAVHAQISQGNKDPTIWKSLSLLAEALKVQHALELLETQGTDSLVKYMEKLEQEAQSGKSKAVQNLVRDLNFRSALIKAKKFHVSNQVYPKVEKVQEIIREKLHEGEKAIIFTQFRDSAESIVNTLNTINTVRAECFVGQTKKGTTGLSQKQQIALLDRFRNNELNVLVATSVAEEGLDIPKVDYVIFYEPIPSAIRHIQRRGRTGRSEKGEVIVLLTEGTRDEGYRWSAFHKEKKMYRILDSLRSTLSRTIAEKNNKQRSLEQFSNAQQEFKIYADVREKGSPVMKHLLDQGVDIRLERLETADYILGSRVGVEFKKVDDFVNSIIDGRLLPQIKALKEQFERPLVVIEGEEDMYSVRKVHGNAIRGMLATIALDFRIPILQTTNPLETAALFSVIAKREQETTGKEFRVHTEKKGVSLTEQQEYIVSALPNIGLSVAKPLLLHFGSVRNIVNATEEQLKDVDLIGPVKAKTIRTVLDRTYEHHSLGNDENETEN